MQFNTEEGMYISVPTDCRERNDMLKRVLDTQGQWVIWDLYGGVGGDAVQFQVLFPRCTLTVVQAPVATSTEGRGRFERLQRNVRQIDTVTKCVYTSNTDFINATEKDTRVDLVYCDPPWYSGKEPLSEWAFVDNLQKEVLTPLSQKGIHPRYLCIKAMYQYSVLSPLLSKFDHKFITEVCPARKKDKNNYFFILLESLQGGKSADVLNDRCTATRFRVWW